MDTNESVAKALQGARAIKGMTYAELAEKSGVSEPTVYRLLQAKRDIKVTQLHALAAALNLSVVEIMQDAELIQERASRIVEVSTSAPDPTHETTDNKNGKAG